MKFTPKENGISYSLLIRLITRITKNIIKFVGDFNDKFVSDLLIILAYLSIRWFLVSIQPMK